MKTKEAQKSISKIEGKFLGFIPQPGGKLKYIQVQVGERIIPIKLPKKLRENLGKKLVEGDRLSVLLEQKSSERFGKVKLKAEYVEKLSNTNTQIFASSPVSSVSQTSQLEKHKQGKILVCRKSSCSKRGGKQLYRALTETLQQLGLQSQVSIELTGCQKQCKKAPSLILMPGKVKHAYVHPEDLASLLKAHYL